MKSKKEMRKTIVLASFILLTSGIAISQNKYPAKVVIDSTLDLSEYYGDTVFLYEPGRIVKVGQRMMALESAEAELHAYKTLYARADSLLKSYDSTRAKVDTVFAKYENRIKGLQVTNSVLIRLNQTKDQDNMHLSEMYREEKERAKRQKFIYGFSGGGIGLLAGIVTTLILVK